MILPEHLQRFPHEALLVAADTVSSKCLLVGGDSLEELNGVALPRETGRDGEGSFEFFPDDAERLRQFAKKLAAHIVKLEREHHIPHIHLIMPAEVERLVTTDLPPDVAAKVGKRIHHDVMKESPLVIATRIVETIVPIPTDTLKRQVGSRKRPQARQRRDLKK